MMMKENINSFSFRRVGLLIKRDVVENWKTWVGFLLISCVVFLFVMVRSFLKMEELLPLGVLNTETAWWGHVDSITLATLALLWCLSFFCASSVMDVEAGRQKAVFFLMLPATMMEKFVVRVLHVVMTPLVAVFCGLCLSELACHLILVWLDLPEIFHQSILLEVVGELNFLASLDDVTYTNSWPMETTYSVLLAQVDVLIWLAWWHSAFLLGGCFWSKHPFGKTLAVMLPLNIVAIAFYVRVVRYLWLDNWAAYYRMCDWCEILSAISPNGLFCAGLGLGMILIVFNWYWAYRFFCRSQVVEPKRFSL